MSHQGTPNLSRESSDASSQSSIIEFVESNDPAARTTIHRHTAQHAAARRRFERLLAARAGLRSGALPWRRLLYSEVPLSIITR